MTEPVNYAVWETGMGWVGLLASSKGLRATTLPYPTPNGAFVALGPEVRGARQDARGLADLMKRFEDYFNGRKVVFPDALEFSGGTPFQQRVWEAARSIPYGETRSYLWVARQAGSPRAARAVGQALGRNPWPIIVPCHRVITSGGGLGGFGGGLEMKQRLLQMEGASARPRLSF